MKKLMIIIMLSCKKATKLIEKKKFVRLGKIESLQLKIHKSVCEYCTKYEVQSNIIDSVMENYYITTDEHQPIENSENIKINILSKLH